MNCKKKEMTKTRSIRSNVLVFITALLAACLLSACGSGSPSSADKDKLQIVTTIFPEYDWVMNLLGAGPAEAEVTMLLDSGVDLHSFQPTAADILKISTCDLFIYVGGGSDAWVDDALKEATNKDMIVINLLEALGDSKEFVRGLHAKCDIDEDKRYILQFPEDTGDRS